MDGTGVRLSDTALGYTLWTFFMNGFCLLSWAMVVRRHEAFGYLRLHWKRGCSAASVPWARMAGTVGDDAGTAGRSRGAA